MLSNINEVTGRKMNEQESEELYKKVKNLQEYKKILLEVEKYIPTSEGDTKLRAKNIVDFLDYSNNFVIVKNIVIEYRDKILLYYQETSSGGTIEENIIASVKIKEKGNHIVRTIYLENNEIVYKDDPFTDQFNKDFELGLPDNIDYNMGETLKNVKLQAWYDGCYPGFNHCGSDCGDFGSRGGGSTEGPYDVCCRTHDRCWHNFGKNDCQCDCQFLSCAKRNWLYAPVLLHSIVLAAFPRKSSCKC